MVPIPNLHLRRERIILQGETPNAVAVPFLGQKHTVRYIRAREVLIAELAE